MADVHEPLVRRKRKKVLVDYFVQFRWILVIFVVLPISTLIYFNIFLGDMWSAMKSEKKRQKQHDENVQKVVKRLKQRNPKKDGLVCTARKPWIAVGMRNVTTSAPGILRLTFLPSGISLRLTKRGWLPRLNPL
jgi:delta24-sterol reductase